MSNYYEHRSMLLVRCAKRHVRSVSARITTMDLNWVLFGAFRDVVMSVRDQLDSRNGAIHNTILRLTRDNHIIFHHILLLLCWHKSI